MNVIKDDVLTARYQRAEILEQGVFSKKVVFNSTLYPHWIGESDCFWYMRESRNGYTFRIVDAKVGSNVEAFDHKALAHALTQASSEQVLVDNLPLADLDLTQAPEVVRFTAFSQCWIYNNKNSNCKKMKSHSSTWKISPDGKKAVFARDYNLWIHDLSTGEERALTLDGERFNEYATSQPMSIYGQQGPSVSLEVLWSPDSKRIFTHIIDIRKVGIAPPLVQHVPTDGSLKPIILNPDNRVAFAGDEHIEAYQFLTINVDSGDCQFADYRACPVMYPPYAGYFTGHLGWWDADSQHAYFIDQERGGKVLNLVKLDTHTGHTQVLFQETSDFAVTLIPLSHIQPLIMYLPGTNELVWLSERSGWAHLYLYDLTAGALKNSITQNELSVGKEWLVRNILHFDAEHRELFIQTAGRVAGRNPYYCDICRINVDTGELTTIMSSDHEYVVCDQRSRISVAYQQAAGISPSGQYVVATRSRVDEVPVSLLLDKNGNELMVLETADVSGLPEHCTWPEPVMLKAADGKTDIYGVVFRPSNFDPTQLYPIIDCTYHYASPVGSFTNNHTGNWHYLSAWAYAELGFITVVIFNRGNDGLRDSFFNSYQNPDFPLAPLNTCRCYKTDCIVGIKQLAEKYNYIDVSRVGVVEFGSTPTALMAMLVHPDFYTVGVSMNAQACSRLEGDIASAHDVESNLDKWPEFEQRANHLQGKLLIMNGMLDWCMYIAMTFRLVEALKNANKHFDMLLLPNLGHELSGYTIQRSWNYVVEHLLGAKPPESFMLVSTFDPNIDGPSCK